MSTVRIETLTMPAASLGPENPLPMLTPRLSATAGRSVHVSVPFRDRTYFGYGLDAGWLPHRGQDAYDRNRVDRTFTALIVENEFLKATILPEVGGRLWSLVHKPSGRELLHVNRVFQPANLGVRGAWVAGGVEWNACVYGHSPYNCSPVFAALVEDRQVGQILRIYEWDRTRCVPYQLDFSLPENSPFLLVRVKLVNPHLQTIPMYWWSNIAVPESPDVRVIVPADAAYTYEYWGEVHSVPIPQHEPLDITYSTNIPYASDYFFRIPDGGRPWITALDHDGRGLIQTSTARQVGRKLFAWGTHSGGKRWQEFLSTPGHPYLEIQAGLSRTQFECAPMPAGAKWEWIEAYGLVEANPAIVHGADWKSAVADVSGQLARSLPAHTLEAQLQQTSELADRQPANILHRGSGWGALELRRRKNCGEGPFCGPGLVFDDDSLGVDQTPWMSLLENGTLPENDPSNEPGALMTQPEWRRLLEASTQRVGSNNWLAQLHLGLMYCDTSDFLAAEEAWQRSILLRPSAWAHRNLAVLLKIKGDYEASTSAYRKAHQLLPTVRPLLIEYCESLLAAHRPDEVLSVIEAAPKQFANDSRVLLLEARAGLALDLPERCQPLLEDDYELVDIREGETSLTDMWHDFQSRQRSEQPASPPAANGNERLKLDSRLPSSLDFRVVPHMA